MSLILKRGPNKMLLRNSGKVLWRCCCPASGCDRSSVRAPFAPHCAIPSSPGYDPWSSNYPWPYPMFISVHGFDFSGAAFDAVAAEMRFRPCLTYWAPYLYPRTYLNALACLFSNLYHGQVVGMKDALDNPGGYVYAPLQYGGGESWSRTWLSGNNTYTVRTRGGPLILQPVMEPSGTCTLDRIVDRLTVDFTQGYINSKADGSYALYTTYSAYARSPGGFNVDLLALAVETPITPQHDGDILTGFNVSGNSTLRFTIYKYGGTAEVTVSNVALNATIRPDVPPGNYCGGASASIAGLTGQNTDGRMLLVMQSDPGNYVSFASGCIGCYYQDAFMGSNPNGMDMADLHIDIGASWSPVGGGNGNAWNVNVSRMADRYSPMDGYSVMENFSASVSIAVPLGQLNGTHAIDFSGSYSYSGMRDDTWEPATGPLWDEIANYLSLSVSLSNMEFTP